MPDIPDPARPVLVTGAAGFIGYHVCEALLGAGKQVVGVDNLNDYYSVSLKQARVESLRSRPGFEFLRADIADRPALDTLFRDRRPSVVVNLAAQVGVRYSVSNPTAYVESNLVGFSNVLEACRQHGVQHLLYASSSSVYGANTKIPFSVEHNVDHPLSLYAATKKANELLAHTYSHLFRLPTTGLRFFTVYGPWGRPDMAVYGFTSRIANGEAIDVYNHGQMRRDFTYVTDIAEAIVRLCDKLPEPNPDWRGDQPDPASSTAPYRVYNIGNSEPVEIMTMIALLEKHIGKQATKRFLPMQPGDVKETFADVSQLERAIGFRPSTPLDLGLERFVTWYRSYHGA
jgi:UDP-glucuronate 4-epimerase